MLSNHQFLKDVHWDQLGKKMKPPEALLIVFVWLLAQKYIQ